MSMARVVKRPVYGSLASCGRRMRQPPVGVGASSQATERNGDDDRSDSSHHSSSGSSGTVECDPVRRPDDFLRYDDDDDDEDDDGASSRTSARVSHNFVDLISQRTLGSDLLGAISVDAGYGTRRLLTNHVLKEHPINLGKMNKIFCSQWLNSRQIVFGSKCNKLTVYDTLKREMFHLPLLRSGEKSRAPDFHCGIHSLSINPSRTVLATGAEDTNHVAFYKLPTFDPLAVGEGAHEDWMFDTVWLDDRFLVSGSRDTTLALWRLDEPIEDCGLHRTARLKPLMVKRCRTAEKVRALAFNKRDLEVAALSLNGYIHIWRADTFKQITSHKLIHGLETVCLSYNDEHSVYAIGSRSHTTLLDCRTLQPIQRRDILSLFPTCGGIRSVSFRGDVLTIGTSAGAILFYDVRAAKYMSSNRHPGEVIFRTNAGWVAMDETSPSFVRYTPAVYTHCYDESGTRLFAAGGPLAFQCQGNYAALWS